MIPATDAPELASSASAVTTATPLTKSAAATGTTGSRGARPRPSMLSSASPHASSSSPYSIPRRTATITSHAVGPRAVVPAAAAATGGDTPTPNRNVPVIVCPSITMTTAPGAVPRRAPGAGVEETGTACAEAVAGRTSSKTAGARIRPASRAAQPPLPRGARWKNITSRAPHGARTSVQHDGEDAQHDQCQQDGDEDGRVILRGARLGQPGRVAIPAHRLAPPGRLAAAHALVVGAPLHDRHSFGGHHGPVWRCAAP